MADLQPYEYEIERLKDLCLFIGGFVVNNETGHLSIGFYRAKNMTFGYTEKLESNWPDLTVTFQTDVESVGSIIFGKENIKTLVDGLWKMSINSPHNTVFLKIDKQNEWLAKWVTGSVNRDDLFTITDPERWN